MRDPNRIDPILARLRAAWIASPDLRLGQLLACSLAIGGAEDKFARLFNAECPEFGAVNAPIEWPPVDRPAPTPTPAPGLDLDAVERAAKMTADREVFVEDGAIYAYDGEACFRVGSAENAAAEEEVASAIVATLNAAPALIAEVRALRRHYDAAGPDHNLLALLDLYHEREQAALAKLAEAKRLGLEAHRIADDAIGSGFILDSDKPDLAAIAAALEAL